MKRPDYRFLKKCTKEELIVMIETRGWSNQLFSWTDVLRYRWNKRSAELLYKQKQHTEKLNTLDAKRQDKLAREFNSCADLDRKLELIELMKPYENSMKVWFEEEKVLQKEELKVDKIYEELSSSYEVSK